MLRITIVAGLFGLLAAAAGCGDGKGKKYDVSGAVSYDGQDVADGDIVFVPEDKTVSPEGGKIKDGKYTAKVPAGKCRVEIRGNRTVPGKKGPMGEDFVESYIPEKYNVKSTLSAEVGSGKTTHDFKLDK
jgi:hypothetical protein